MYIACLSSAFKFRPYLKRKFFAASLSPKTFAPRCTLMLPWSVVKITFAFFISEIVFKMESNDECLNQLSVSERNAGSSGEISFKTSLSERLWTIISRKLITTAIKCVFLCEITFCAKERPTAGSIILRYFISLRNFTLWRCKSKSSKSFSYLFNWLSFSNLFTQYSG